MNSYRTIPATIWMACLTMLLANDVTKIDMDIFTTFFSMMNY